MESDEFMFLGGLVAFVIGSAMVLAQNVWVKNWQVVMAKYNKKLYKTSLGGGTCSIGG